MITSDKMLELLSSQNIEIGGEKINNLNNFKDNGIDSISLMMLIVLIEEEYKIEIDTSLLSNLDVLSVNDFMAKINNIIKLEVSQRC